MSFVPASHCQVVALSRQDIAPLFSFCFVTTHHDISSTPPRRPHGALELLVLSFQFDLIYLQPGGTGTGIRLGDGQCRSGSARGTRCSALHGMRQDEADQPPPSEPHRATAGAHSPTFSMPESTENATGCEEELRWVLDLSRLVKNSTWPTEGIRIRLTNSCRGSEDEP